MPDRCTRLLFRLRSLWRTPTIGVTMCSSESSTRHRLLVSRASTSPTFPQPPRRATAGTTSDLRRRDPPERFDLRRRPVRPELGAHAAGRRHAPAISDLAGTPITRRSAGPASSSPRSPSPAAGQPSWGNGSLLVETSDHVPRPVREPVRYFDDLAQNIKLGELGLDASNLGSISTYAALLARRVDQRPSQSQSVLRNRVAYWCQRVCRRRPRLSHRLRRRSDDRRRCQQSDATHLELRRRRRGDRRPARPTARRRCGRDRSRRHADRPAAPG